MLGCLQCLNKQTFDGKEEGVTFERQDIELCQAFASIAAVAIVQVRVRGRVNLALTLTLTLTLT